MSNLKTTTRGSSVTHLLPFNDDLNKAKEVAGSTVEGAEYLLKQFAAQLKLTGKFDEAQAKFQNIVEFSKNVARQHQSNNKHWDGQMPTKTGFQNLYENIAKDLGAELSTTVSNIKVDCAVSDSSELIRGFSTEGEPLDIHETERFDRLLNAWFAKNNLSNKNSVLYEANPDGEIQLDQRGQPIIANSEKLRNLINDRNNGLGSFLEANGIQAQVQQHPFPQQTPTATSTQTSQKSQAVTEASSPPKQESPNNPGSSSFGG